MLDWRRFEEAVEGGGGPVLTGKVTRVVGLVVEGFVPGATVGSLCDVYTGEETGGRSGRITCEVVGFGGHTAMMMPHGDIRGVRMGSTVVPRQGDALVEVGEGLLGRVVDALGRPLDGLGPLRAPGRVPLHGVPQNPMERRPIREPLALGIRAIDGLITCGKGQRVAIMAGSGVGKSVLLGMIARNTAADVNVVAMIGERGREVRDFIQGCLGPEGLRRSVVVVATSDQPPLLRLRGALVASAIAEYFRDQGADCLLLMDSVTRFAMAQREVGLAVGEPPTTRGYTPSVFALMPRLLERAGSVEGRGTITGLYTVLVEGDDMNDPVGDAVRSLVDGHIVLSRQLAARNHYPSIDVLQSVSRVMGAVTTPEHQGLAGRFRDLLATYREAEDLVNVGAYVPGSNPRIDAALARIGDMETFLRQGVGERTDFGTTLARLAAAVAEGKTDRSLPAAGARSKAVMAAARRTEVAA